MSVEVAALAVAELLGADADVVLDEAGWDSWAAAIAALPAPALQGALGKRPAGFAVLLLLRERAASTELRPAVAVTRALIRWLGDRLGAEHPDTLAELGMLGVLAERSGRRDRAMGLMEQAWTGLRAAGSHERAAAVGRRLVEVFAAEGRLGDALITMDACWETLKRGPTAGVVGLQRAELSSRLGHSDSAVLAATEAWEAHLATAGEAAASTPALGLAIGRLLVASRSFGTARGPLRVAVERGRALGWAGWPEAAFLLIQALESTGVGDEALRTLEDALRSARSGPTGVSAVWLALAARVMASRGRADEAERLLMEAMEVDRRAHGPASVEVAQRQAAIGRFLLRQGRVDEALGWLETAVGVLRRALPIEHESVRTAAEDLVTALVNRRSEAASQGDRDAMAWCEQGLSGVVPALVSPEHPVLRSSRSLGAR